MLQHPVVPSLRNCLLRVCFAGNPPLLVIERVLFFTCSPSVIALFLRHEMVLRPCFFADRPSTFKSTPEKCVESNVLYMGGAWGFTFLPMITLSGLCPASFTAFPFSRPIFVASFFLGCLAPEQRQTLSAPLLTSHRTPNVLFFVVCLNPR